MPFNGMNLNIRKIGRQLYKSSTRFTNVHVWKSMYWAQPNINHL